MLFRPTRKVLPKNMSAIAATICRVPKLKNVAGDSRGFVEMAAWDESRVERTNVSVFQKFPNGIHKRVL